MIKYSGKKQMKGRKMITYSHSKQEDREELVDVADKIFTLGEKAPGEYDENFFQNLHPRIYGKDGELKDHIVARDNGKIIGLALKETNDVYYGGYKLKAGGIGTVGVLKEYRNQGIMSEMLRRCEEAMREEGVDYACLSGSHVRYQHFGYEASMPFYIITLHDSDFYHMPEVKGYEFISTKELTDEETKVFKAMYEEGSVYHHREEKYFMMTASCWNSRFVKIVKDGELFGYMVVADYGHEIKEFRIKDKKEIVPMFRAYYATLERWTEVKLWCFSPLDSDWVAEFTDVACGYQLTTGEMAIILNFRNCIEKMLSAKAKIQGLIPGEFTMEIEGEKPFRVIVDGKTVKTEDCDRGDYKFTRREAAILLVIPGLLPGARPDIPAYVASYFPLPISCPLQDTV